MGLEKKGVFFSIDALIALILILGVILIAYPYVRDAKHQSKLDEDVISTLSSIKIGALNTSLTSSLISQGIIIDLNKSLLEQIGEFYATNVTLAKQLASDALSKLNATENIGIWYGNTLLLSKNKTSFENAKNVETARQIISGVKEGGSATGYSARAFLTSSLQNKYVYFGGYIGDGNITFRIDYNGNISAATIEFTSNTNITVKINGGNNVTYPQSPSEDTPSNYSLPINNFVSGTNLVELSGKNLHLAGGFIKITYQSGGQYQQPTKYYFPGIVGAINVYTGAYVPSQINSMQLLLHLNSSYNTFVTIGNTTVFSNKSNGEETKTLTNSQLTALLNYNQLSNNTIPIRIGLENLSLSNATGNADVVLITDISGSMAWRLDQDSVNGVVRTNCSDPLIKDPSTERLSLAKCLDKSFSDTILKGANKIALVSFSSSANTYLDLTNNGTLVNNTINSYSASGATCISCALNRAYSILQAQSNSSRQKFIIVMTDGVANVRSTASCNSIYGAGNAQSNVLSGGVSGLALSRINESWMSLSKVSSAQINDIDLFNTTFGFAVSSTGTILKWNGTTWSNFTSPVATALNGLDILNGTYGLATGASGKVLKWNGTTWTTVATISNNPTLYRVSVYNSTLAFAVASRSNTGYIYKSINSGVTWTQDYSAGSNFKGIKILNSTLAFAVGDSGRMAKWTAGTWSTPSSATTDDLYSIESFNNTLAYAVGGDSGNSVAIKWNGVTWSSSYSQAYNSLQDLVVLNNITYAIGLDATIVENNGTWYRNFNLPEAYQGNNTAGVTCTADQDSCSEVNSFPALNANYSSCRARNDLNTTVHSIGFGPVSTCSFATKTLQAIASCGNGSYYASSNASTLQQIYSSLASSIVQLTYLEQNSQIIGNITAVLYPDSYIEINYTSPAVPYGLVVTTEKQFTNSSSASFTRPSNTTSVEGQIVSYSGTKWTNQVLLNNLPIYNLSKYGSDYQKLGDPYVIGIKPSLINSSNTVWLNTGTAPQNTSQGSSSNKVIHTVVKNVSGYSPVVAQASGCIWTIQFEDNSNITVKSPYTYTGSEICSFTSALQSYNSNDAFQAATFSILRSLDFNQNYKVDVPFNQQDLQISLTQTTGIPYTWSTEVQVRVWQ